MTVSLPPDQMPEAEVALRLAFHLLEHPASSDEASVALDGAQIRVQRRQVFPIRPFLFDLGWKQVAQSGKNQWQGEYERKGSRLVLHSSPGVGDVVAHVGQARIRAECKKGPLIYKPGGKEYPALHEALGQALTVDSVEPGDVLAVAVPLTDRFSRLIARWRTAPLVVRSEIRLVMVGRDGSVHGLELTKRQ